MKTLAEQMNDDAWCNYCWKTTVTKEWDCVKCGFSKPHPEEYIEQKQRECVHEAFIIRKGGQETGLSACVHCGFTGTVYKVVKRA